MAQVTNKRESSTWQVVRDVNNLAVSVPASGNTTILQVNTYGLERIFVQFDVTVNAFDAFLIRAKCSPDATTTTLYSTAGAFTTPVGLLVGASGDLTTQAVGSGWFILDVKGLWEVTVQASGSGGASTVDVYMGGR